MNVKKLLTSDDLSGENKVLLVVIIPSVIFTSLLDNRNDVVQLSDSNDVWTLT